MRRVLLYNSTPAITWDATPGRNGGNVTFSNGNLRAVFSATNSMIISTDNHTIVGAGGNKYMYEIVVNSGLNETIGITKYPTSFATFPGGSTSLSDSYGAYTFMFYLYRNSVANTTSSSSGYSISPNVIGVVLDTNAGTLQYYYNGVLVTYSSGTPVVTGLTGTFYAAVGSDGGSCDITAKFSNFTYPIPGVLGW